MGEIQCPLGQGILDWSIDFLALQFVGGEPGRALKDIIVKVSYWGPHTSCDRYIFLLFNTLPGGFYMMELTL